MRTSTQVTTISDATSIKINAGSGSVVAAPTPPVAPASGSTSLKGKAIRASAWMISLQIAVAIIRLVSNLILARLLVPEHFGSMTLVLAFMTGLQMLSDVGLLQSLVQSKRGQEPAFYNTVWTLEVLRGCTIWLIACLIAWPSAWFFKEPGLVHYLPVTGLLAVINGFSSTSLSTLYRNLEGRTLPLLGFTKMVIHTGVMVLWASISPSVWALVAGALSAQCFMAVVSHFILPEVRNRFHYDRSAVREILGLGRWIFLSTMLTFFGQQFDRFLMARMIGLKQLGVYSAAMTISTVPRDWSGTLLNYALYPVLAHKAREGPQQLQQALLKARRVALPFIMFSLLGVATMADLFFTYLYKSEFHAAGWMSQILCLASWFTILRLAGDRTLLVLNDSRTLSISEGVKLVVLVITSLIGHRLMGMPGFILGVASGAMAGHIVILMRLRAHGISVWLHDLLYTLWLVGLALAGIYGPKLLSRFLGLDTQAKQAILTLACAVLIVGSVGLWMLMRFRTDLFARSKSKQVA